MSSAMKIQGYQNMVATIFGRHYPGWKQEGATLVDVRHFNAAMELVHLPEYLRQSGMPEDLIRQAGESKPPGFLLLPDERFLQPPPEPSV